MRNLTPSTLNELASWLVARSCMAAIVAIPPFGVSALAGQTTDESDIAATRLTEVVRSVNGDGGLDPFAAELNGTPTRPGGSESPEDAVAGCIDCHHDMFSGVYWHITWGSVTTPWVLAYNWSPHGTHWEWYQYNCDYTHGVCINIPSPDGAQALTLPELARGISDAVAAQDIAALAAYASMPSVNLFTERSAIQIQGCDGGTIAGHIPVNPELLVAIQVAAAQLDSDR